jgi:hypothetical protein
MINSLRALDFQKADRWAIKLKSVTGYSWKENAKRLMALFQ